MNEMLKKLMIFEQKFKATSLSDRRQFSKKSDPNEELKEVMGEVKNIEGAMFKCCEIAKFAIQKYEDLANKHQHMAIDYEDIQQSKAIHEDRHLQNQEA